MRTATALTLLAAALAPAWNPGAADQPGPQPVRRAHGIEKRTPWTTSRVKGSPEPPAPYRTEPAFPRVKFNAPLDVTSAPGSDRFFVAERRGKIYSFPNRPDAEVADLVIDLKQTVYGIAAHPRFAENRYLYVTYLPHGEKELPNGTRIARFTLTKDDPPRADLKSEKVIFEWPSGGHNGGCLKFGPDGMLYVATGDGSGIADSLLTGQDLSDLLGSILRIDVDRPDDGKGYSVPKDNPFVGREGARPEIWAYGLRQPWRMSFDRLKGDLWAGEVGQDLWEMVYKIEKGGNYGWSVTEGRHPFRPERKRGPTPILAPVAEHPHSDFRSITGGYVYRGGRLKDLAGAYVYGDFDTGRVWALRHDGKRVTWQHQLVPTTLRVVAFAEDNASELYLLDYVGGQLHRLAPAPKKDDNADKFPRKLSETGLFTSVNDLKPAPGLIPYSVNSQLWADHATKERYLAVPGDGKIEFESVTYPQPLPLGWKFPHDTVLVKTFFLDMERGNPATRRRLETRLLHFQKFGGDNAIGDQYWHGYTYVWNDDQTEAYLLDAAGLDRTFTVKDKNAPGGKVEQKWHFPSRAECTLCHTMAAKYALGVHTWQMNREHDYGGVLANQLATLEHLGMFTEKLPQRPAELPRLVDHDDEAQPLEARARSYLHSNCMHCHIKWGGGNADFHLPFTLPLKNTGLIDVKPGQGDFGIKGARLLAPGHPERSLIYHRMTMTGLGRMPHIATSMVDERGAKVVHDWIKGMRGPQGAEGILSPK